MEVPAERLVEVCLALRDEPRLRFAQLVDLCAVDYLEYGEADWETSESATGAGFSRGVRARGPAGGARETPRFALVYQLLSHQHNLRLRLRAFPQEVDPPRVASVVEVWASANWYEREAFDLFGVPVRGSSRSPPHSHRLRLHRASLPQGLFRSPERWRCATTRKRNASCTSR